MNDFCMCSDLKDKNQRIHELEEKIHEYKAEIRDLHQVDISDLKKMIRCLKERIDELDCENEFLTKRVEELEDDNGKLESLKQHLINHVSNKEAEIVNLKEENEELERENERLNELASPSKVLLSFHDDTNRFELFCNGHEIADQVYDVLTHVERRIEELRVENEKLTQALKTDINRVYGVESSLEKDSTDGSYIYISIPKGQKVSNFEIHFQDEKAPSITMPYKPIDPLITPTVTYVQGKGPTITYGSGTGGDAQ